MNANSEFLVDLIFKKLKNYKSREIFLEREDLRKFIFTLYKESWFQIKYNKLYEVIKNQKLYYVQSILFNLFSNNIIYYQPLFLI